MEKILKRCFYLYLYPLTVILASISFFEDINYIEACLTMEIWFIIAGGIFPILMSLVFKINTGEHIKEQLTALVISIILCAASWFSLIYLGMTDLVILYVPVFCVIAAIVYWIVKIHELKQCVFLIFSNPIMYYAILVIFVFCGFPFEN